MLQVQCNVVHISWKILIHCPLFPMFISSLTFLHRTVCLAFSTVSGSASVSLLRSGSSNSASTDYGPALSTSVQDNNTVLKSLTLYSLGPNLPRNTVIYLFVSAHGLELYFHLPAYWLVHIIPSVG